MSQPLTDGGEVYAGSQERDRCAVTQAVWMKTLALKSAHIGANPVQMFRQNVSNPKASQRLPSVIEKDSRIRAETQMLFLAMIAE